MQDASLLGFCLGLLASCHSTATASASLCLARSQTALGGNCFFFCYFTAIAFVVVVVVLAVLHALLLYFILLFLYFRFRCCDEKLLKWPAGDTFR